MKKVNFTHWIQTYSGKAIDLLNPEIDSLDIQDISHALTNINRFNGNSIRPYSVAEHSLNVVKLLEHWEPTNYQLHWDGLHHDGPEAYICDLPSPIKRLCKDYQEIESKFEKIYSEKFKTTFPLPNLVIKADLIMLDYEKKHLFYHEYDWNLPYDYREELGTELIFIPVDMWHHSTHWNFGSLLKEQFIQKYKFLANKLNINF